MPYEDHNSDQDKISELYYEKLKLEIETNQRLMSEALKHQENSIEQVSDNFEKRLTALNGIKDLFKEYSLTSVPREEASAKFDSLSKDIVTKFDAVNTRLESSLGPIHDKVNAIGRPNYLVVIGILGFGVSVLTGAWFIITMLIGNSNGPINSSIEQLKAVQQTNELRLRKVEDQSARSLEADSASKTDRIQLNTRLHELEGQVDRVEGTQQTYSSENRQKLIEIETQMRNAGNVVNMTTDRFEEWLKVLFDKVYPGQHFLGTHFRPDFHKNEVDK